VSWRARMIGTFDKPPTKCISSNVTLRPGRSTPAA